MKKDQSKQPKIVIYRDHSVIYNSQGSEEIFSEGKQSYNANKRYKKITKALQDGFLHNLFKEISPNMVIKASQLPQKYRTILSTLVNSITSEVGRALVGLTINQLVIKAIAPEQSIRLHKGSNSKGKFSWAEGISMRSIDSKYVTPFLRKNDLLSMNKSGVFMTRSLAENYPYSQLYKAELRGDKEDWIDIVDAIESNSIDALSALKYTLALLKNHSTYFIKLANNAHSEALRFTNSHDFTEIENTIASFVANSNYKARIFEVAMHSFFQALQDFNLLEGTLSPMTQMRSANKKHSNVGDIEIYNGDALIEAWDAKFGKEYLRDELEELDDKISNRSDIEITGFVTDKKPVMDKEIANRISELIFKDNVDIKILSFTDWIKLELKAKEVPINKLNEIGKNWLMDLTDSLGQKRRKIAPIDEPSDEWLKELIAILK